MNKEYTFESFIVMEGERFTIPSEAREVEYDYGYSEEHRVMVLRVSYLLPADWNAVQ